MDLKLGELVRPIKGYEGLYSVTSHGRIWSHEKTAKSGKGGGQRIYGNTFMSPGLITDGYLIVQLSHFGKKKYLRVNRIVAATFIENLNAHPQVNHKDGNPQNNYVGTLENNFKDGNLEWCTQLQNAIHRSVNGFIKNATSKYPGVSFDSRRNCKKKPWQARFQMNKKRTYLGTFTTEQEAAKVYYLYVDTNYSNAFDLVKDKLKEFYNGVVDFEEN